MIRSTDSFVRAAALVLVLAAGCSGPERIPVAIPSDTNATAIAEAAQAAATPLTSALGVPLELQVPYSETSVWNTPIGPSPAYDLHSEEMIATLVLANDGQIVTAGDNYNFPVYAADDQTPRWDIPCVLHKCTIASSDDDIERTEMVQDVPIPVDAQPGGGSDSRMIIIDLVNFTEYDLNKAQRTATGWEAGTVSVYNVLWNGTPTGHSSRGSGIPAMAGLLRPWEIRQGRIEHALAFGFTETARDACVYPASKTDGNSRLSFAIPMGARLQLDPALTDADFDQMGLNPSAKIIARALQEYGMILVDTSGAFKIYMEDLVNNPFAMEQWTDPGLDLTKESIYGIPFSSFRVLELPPGHWEPSENSPEHGQCVAFPESP